ncbi:MAG: 16S rRNA (guanine(527)-N(7))-methyltransferase RsmG [Pseudomonadota bacterium]|nr:16S rRNA (guanine(527)-N(7))-methyltransferase RsmG [Pseudomonadota bacterium]
MSAPLTADTFAADVSRETRDRLSVLVDLLGRWNPKINLVAPSTLPDVWRRHVLDSWQVVDLAPPGTRNWIDIGSGGGFPGLVVAASGRFAVTLIESDARKCVFLREAARQMGVAIDVRTARIESVRDLQANVVSARALAPLEKLLPLAAPLLAPGGRGIFLKGQDVERELTAATKYWTFSHQQHPSRSDPRGTVLVIEELRQR